MGRAQRLPRPPRPTGPRPACFPASSVHASGFRLRVELKRAALPPALPHVLLARLSCGIEGVLSDASVRKIVTPVRACFRSAVREGLRRDNPARDLALPHRPSIEEEGEVIRVFTREQLGQFLAIVNPSYRVLFRLLASTGVRIGDAIALEWRHVHLDGSSPHIKVRQQLYRNRTQPPKSKYGRRDIPIDAQLVSELRKHRMTEWAEDDQYVFRSAAGTPLNVANVRNRVLRPVAEEIGAPWAGFHAFRHTFASLVFEGGANAVQVQRLLGHHSPAFTLATYVHLLEGSIGEPRSLADELAGVTPGVTTPTKTHQSQEVLIDSA